MKARIESIVKRVLYAKYGIMKEEQAFIESMIKPMEQEEEEAGGTSSSEGNFYEASIFREQKTWAIYSVNLRGNYYVLELGKGIA